MNTLHATFTILGRMSASPTSWFRACRRTFRAGSAPVPFRCDPAALSVLRCDPASRPVRGSARFFPGSATGPLSGVCACSSPCVLHASTTNQKLLDLPCTCILACHMHSTSQCPRKSAREVSTRVWGFMIACGTHMYLSAAHQPTDQQPRHVCAFLSFLHSMPPRRAHSASLPHAVPHLPLHIAA